MLVKKLSKNKFVNYIQKDRYEMYIKIIKILQKMEFKLILKVYWNLIL